MVCKFVCGLVAKIRLLFNEIRNGVLLFCKKVDSSGMVFGRNQGNVSLF